MRIFISYRWADSKVLVDKLYRRLSKEFGPENIFRDEESILPGDNIRREIVTALTTNNPDVVLVVIGSKWLDIKGASGKRRLNEIEDLVRFEIEIALSRQIRVVPLFIDDATIPRVKDLPDTISGIPQVKGQFIRSSKYGFNQDTTKLIEALRLIDLRILSRQPQSSSALHSPQRLYRRIMFLIIFVVFIFVCFVIALVRIPPHVEVAYEFLIDVSEAMNDPMQNGQTRYHVASDIVTQVIGEADPRARWNGVRTAGGGIGSNCSITRTLMMDSTYRPDIDTLENKLREIIPSDNTAYNAGLDTAAEDLKNLNSPIRLLFVFFNSSRPSPNCINQDTLNLKQLLTTYRQSSIVL